MSVERLQARMRHMPGDALFSGRTAGWLHGLDVPACDPIEVTLPQSSRTSHLAGVKVTRSDFYESEVCVVEGLPATSKTRTLADLCRRLPLVEAVAFLDMALHDRLVNLDDLDEWTDDHPRHRGVSRLTQAMALCDGGSESPMESRLRMLLVTNGLPKPEVQRSIRDASGLFLARADLCYAGERLVLEYDGALHRDRLAADNRRQNRLVESGYRVLRFTAGDILNRPASVVAQVQRALCYSIGSPN